MTSAPQGSLEARPVQLGPVRLGQPALLHRHHHLHLRASTSPTSWSAIRSRARPTWAFTQSTSGIIIALLSPFLGAMADAGGRRKPYIFFFQCLVAVGCFTLWWAYPHRPDLVSPISWAVVVATIGAEMSIVFNNCAAAHHRAARAHGPAERLRLGPGLLRRPFGAVRRADREPPLDVRPGRPTTSRCSGSIPRPTRSNAWSVRRRWCGWRCS